MNENRPDPINLLLSREELLLALDLLQAETIPGLEPDPTFGNLTPEQRQLAVTFAERALRAREMLRVQPDGELVIHRLLLAAVGACAYPDHALFVYHWPGGQTTPLRYFGHRRGDDIVAHTLPEAALHLFSLLPDQESLLEQALTAAGYVESNGAESAAFELPAAAFGQARTQAAAGDTAQAVDTLAAHDDAAEDVSPLVETLADAPRVTIFQTLTPTGDPSAPQRRDVTLLQDEQRGWLVYPAPDQPETLRVETASRAALLAQLSAGLPHGKETS